MCVVDPARLAILGGVVPELEAALHREEAIRLAAEQEAASMELARKRLVGDLQQARAKLDHPTSGDAPKRPQSAVARPPSTVSRMPPARPASARLAGRI